MADHFSRKLISAHENLHAGDCMLTGDELTLDSPKPWFVRMTRLHGGKQQGVDLITLFNGVLTIRVCPTRGMGIVDVVKGGLRLGWDSPVKELVHPAFIDLERRGGTGWLEGFSEFLVRCGLEYMGPPCEDTHHAAVGEPPAARVTLHGKIANTPASEVELIVQTVAPYAITLRGVVHERAMYGPKLELATELVVVPGEDSFTVNDIITNRGGQAQEMALLYHLNQGRPILEEGARFIAPIKSAKPRDAHYTSDGVGRYGPPVQASTEECHYMDLAADADGRVHTLLHNASADRGLSVSWLKAQLPRFALWKALHDERDGYVTGLEPAVTLPNPRPVEREAGRLVTIPPGGSYAVSLSFALHDDKESVRRSASAITAG